MKNKDLTVSNIFEKLTDEQKKWAYYCIGTAVEGKSPRRFKKYRELMESVDDISKKVINELIDKALEYGQEVTDGVEDKPEALKKKFNYRYS